MRTPRGHLDLARVMDARPLRLVFRLRVPHAMPALATGLRLAAVYAPLGAVIGEWVGASRGLGHLMLLANGRGQTDLMFACLFVLAAFTVLLHRLVDGLGAALTARFAEPAGLKRFFDLTGSDRPLYLLVVSHHRARRRLAPRRSGPSGRGADGAAAPRAPPRPAPPASRRGADRD